MARKPKTAWQIALRTELDRRGIGYKELADAIGYKEGSVRQLASKDNQPILKKKVSKYLGIEDE